MPGARIPHFPGRRRHVALRTARHRHPDDVGPQGGIVQLAEHVTLHFGDPPKTDRSRRSRQEHDPHRSDVLVELRAQVRDVRRQRFVRPHGTATRRKKEDGRKKKDEGKRKDEGKGRRKATFFCLPFSVFGLPFPAIFGLPFRLRSSVWSSVFRPPSSVLRLPSSVFRPPSSVLLLPRRVARAAAHQEDQQDRSDH